MSVFSAARHPRENEGFAIESYIGRIGAINVEFTFVSIRDDELNTVEAEVFHLLMAELIIRYRRNS